MNPNTSTMHRAEPAQRSVSPNPSPFTAAPVPAPAHWVHVCDVHDIVPDTGVCALVGGVQVAIFRLTSPQSDALRNGGDTGELFFAIDNYDPVSRAAVLSRGIVGSLENRIVVASPIYKQHFDLRTGECLESPEHAVRRFPVQLRDAQLWIDVGILAGC